MDNTNMKFNFDNMNCFGPPHKVFPIFPNFSVAHWLMNCCLWMNDEAIVIFPQFIWHDLDCGTKYVLRVASLVK